MKQSDPPRLAPYLQHTGSEDVLAPNSSNGIDSPSKFIVIANKSSRVSVSVNQYFY